MKFWKEHAVLRAGLMALLFVAGLILIVGGWRLTGTLVGLGIMLCGTGLLLCALYLYNRPFEDDRHK